MSSDTRPVFVYGTLVDAERVDTLLDDWRFDGPAVIDGLHRVDGRYPTLAPGGEVHGRLLVTPELDTLDAYEGVPAGLYVRVAVPMDPDDDAWLFVGDPGRLEADEGWPGEGPFAERVRRYVSSGRVMLRRVDNR